jgi:vacuolar-type H+-ATPase subunit I/STV1
MKTKKTDISKADFDNVNIILKSLEKEISPTVKRQNKFEVTTKEEFELASSLLKGLKQLSKMAKDKEEELTVPLTQVVKGIKELFKPFRDLVAATEEDTKLKLTAFVNLQERKAKALDESFDNGKIKKVSTLVSKKNDLIINSKSAQVRKIWQAVPIDESLTPRKYLVPNVAMIKEDLAAGIDVPGWEYVQKTNIAI